MLTSAGGQPALVMSTSRQCCWRLIRLRAGNQAAACESPNSTTEVLELGSPYTHGRLRTPGCWRWQPLTTIAGRAREAGDSGGLRMEGTYRDLAPFCRSAVSCSGVIWWLAVRRGEAALALDTSGPTSDPDSSTAATATAARVPPQASPSTGRRTTTFMRRMGRSTR